MFDKPKLITKSVGKYTECYLYSVELPCALNPYLYFIFKDFETSAISMLGNYKNDCCVKVVRKEITNNDANYVEDIISKIDAEKPQFSLNNDGKLIINESMTDTDYCLRLLDEWQRAIYEPYYYHDDTSPSPMMNIVFPNQQIEFELLESFEKYCEGENSCHSVNDFTSSMISFFIGLFRTQGQYDPLVDGVCLAYKEYFERASPKQIVECIGPVLDMLQTKNVSENEIMLTQSIVCIDSMTFEKRIYNEFKADAVYSIHFYNTYLSIHEKDNCRIDITYKNANFQYEFILLP